MEKFAQWYHRQRLSIRLVLQALSIALPFYFSAFLSYQISKIGDTNGWVGIGIHAIIFVILFFLIVLTQRYFLIYITQIDNIQRERNSFVQHAYTKVDRLVTQSLSRLVGEQPENEVLHQALNSDLEKMKETIQALYETFEATYGKGPDFESRIEFEVTFMTKSYIDGKITIPISANKDGRAPLSMNLRKSDQNIYDGTVTDLTYREARPSIHVIGDTMDPQSNYRVLYTGQTERLRSSIIFPVLSGRNELLGTLVVHCDRADFFQEQDKRYWGTVLEIFGRRVALVKKHLDLIVAVASSGVGKIQGTLPTAPF